jgi:hypothetical protein
MKYRIEHQVITVRASAEADDSEVFEILARYLAKLAPNYGALVIERVE